MAIYKPLRLGKMANRYASSASFFALYSSATDTVYDSDIHSVVIHRGKSGRGGGSHPSTMEVNLKGGFTNTLAGKNVRFMVRDLPASNLAAELGTTGPAIARRFTGRLGQSSIEDTGRKLQTTITAASWITQMNYSTRKYKPTTGEPILSTIFALTGADDPLRGIDMYLYGDSDTIARDQESVTFREGITKYAEEIGVLMQETRIGQTKVFGHLWRLDHAESVVSSSLPLTRSQAISPAVWEQSNERPAIIADFLITNSADVVVKRTAEITNPTGELRERETFDWQYVKMVNAEGQLYREAYGRVFETSPLFWSIPSVKVDLIHLINSPKQYHKDQAGQLLALEAGDPVFFSGDWPQNLQGTHFAEGIKETITPTEWTLELSLVPIAVALGANRDLNIRPRVWDSAGTAQWDTQTRQWKDAL